MSTGENFKFCSNCEKQIPANKWILHENFCIQHVKKCEICGEIINKEEEEEHIQDFHSKRKCEVCNEEFEGEAYFTHKRTCLSKVKCRFCHKEFAPKAFEGHEKNCDLNLFNCAFCFSDHPVKDKQDHEYFCGAKTEKCAKCDKYVRLRDMDVHISMDCHPEEIPISQKVDLNSIQVRSRKATGKTSTGVIASLNQMGILHKGDSKSKVKVKPNSNISITESLINKNDNSSSANSNLQANNLIKNIKTNQPTNKHENINEAPKNIKTHNLKPQNINSVNPVVNHNNSSIPVKIERKDLTPMKQNSNLQVNKPTAGKEKPNETKNSSLYHNNNSDKNTNEPLKKLKEIENNLANLNNLGKNCQNINSLIDKPNGRVNNKLSNATNKENKINTGNKTEATNNIKPAAHGTNKPKSSGSGLNINYGLFEENKYEEPKSNVFYEKHESQFNSNLNDDDYINVNKNAKDKLLSANRYENINDIPNESPTNNPSKGRIHEKKNPLGGNQNIKHHPVDKDHKKKTAEILKSNKAPEPSVKHSSAIGNKDKKPVHKESTTNNAINPNLNINSINNKIVSNKPSYEARIVKNFPYSKHFDINTATPSTNNINNSKKQKPELNSAMNKASAGSSIYNINSFLSNEAADNDKRTKNTHNDLNKLDQYILNPKAAPSGSNNNKNHDKSSQLNKNINKIEEKINPVDNSKKLAYGSNKGKEDCKDKASSKNSNFVIKNGNIKGSKKAPDINAKNFHYEDYQDDFLYDEGFNTQDYYKKQGQKDGNYDKQLEDEILNKVILESLKHK